MVCHEKIRIIGCEYYRLGIFGYNEISKMSSRWWSWCYYGVCSVSNREHSHNADSPDFSPFPSSAPFTAFPPSPPSHEAYSRNLRPSDTGYPPIANIQWRVSGYSCFITVVHGTPVLPAYALTEWSWRWSKNFRFWGGCELSWRVLTGGRLVSGIEQCCRDWGRSRDSGGRHAICGRWDSWIQPLSPSASVLFPSLPWKAGGNATVTSFYSPLAIRNWTSRKPSDCVTGRLEIPPPQK